jgi:hypothetical protein
MKMKKQCSILLIVLFFSWTGMHLYGQGIYGHVTPQTADFIRYGETPVSLFTGKINLEVPIYRIQDQDFDIPISLLYSSDGFKLEKRSDLVGLDWTLIAGGCISREVYGAPDESKAISIYGQEMGYLFAAESPEYNSNQIWNFNPSVVLADNTSRYYYLKRYNGSFFVDYQPDLFLFNFNGHTGQFMIDGNGTARANRKGYKVDISGLTKQDTYEVILPYNSTIKITTPEGYVYEFGGSLNALEFSVSFTDGVQWSMGTTHPTILAWHLTKITAPNGRIVTFNYVTDENMSAHGLSKTSPLWQSSNNAPPHSGQAVKKAVLESIEAGKIKVEFKSAIETTLASYNNIFFTTHTDFNRAVYQLDSVFIKYNNAVQYRYRLNYTSQNKRRFLSSVVQPDNSRYEFSYNHTNYPSPSVQGQTDNYGYWTANSDNNSYGLLSRVDYPTRGHSRFFYEPHQHAFSVELNLSSLTKELSPSSNIEMHGARIKKIFHYTNETTQTTEKEYIYKDTINGVGSSGILYSCRPYERTLSGSKSYIIEPSFDKNYNIEESPIGYSSVFERNSDGSYWKYKFSDYRANPDRNEVKQQYYPNTLPDNSELIYALVSRVSSNSNKRGLLMDKYAYDSAGNEKTHEFFEYKNVSSFHLQPTDFFSDVIDETDYFIVFGSLPGGCIAKKIFLEFHPILYKEEKTDGVVKKEKYRYNNYDLLKTYSTVTNLADTLKINYTYPFDYTANPYLEMVSTNRLSTVIEKVTTYIKGATHTGIERIKTDYIKDATRTKSLILPDKISTSYSGVNDFNIDIRYDLYDNFGKVLQYTSSDEIPVVCLWGYNGLHPVAEIKSASYNQVVEQIQGKQTTIDNIASNATLSITDMEKVNALRIALPNAQVTTYTYAPLIGITTITDSRNITIYYEYENSRLKEKYYKDNNLKKTIENYSYHYRD